MRQGILIFILGLGLPVLANASSSHHVAPLKHADVRLKDNASLQSGAKIFMNYCSGCHSLGYMRYMHVAKDLGIVDATGHVNQTLFRDNLIFTGAKIGDLIKVAIPHKDAKGWFGIVPPDLTLEARVRGADWLFSFVSGFYIDQKRPWGVNNIVFPDVAMPDVLEGLRGEQMPVFRTDKIPYDGGYKDVQVLDHLVLMKPGRMSEHQFSHAMNDLVSFMVYVAEPMKLTRVHMGIRVLAFLLLLLVVAYFLKKEFWRDVK